MSQCDGTNPGIADLPIGFGPEDDVIAKASDLPMLHPARLKLMKALGQLEVLQKRMDEQTTAMADLRATLDKWEAARSRKAEDERLLAEYKETSVTPIEIPKRRGIERERYLSSRD